MTLFHGSKYRFEDLVSITDTNGTTVAHHPLRPTTVEAESDFRRYRVAAGDTMESIAFAQYSDANKWYVIADANPQIFWPLDLAVGVELLLPPKTYAELN